MLLTLLVLFDFYCAQLWKRNRLNNTLVKKAC